MVEIEASIIEWCREQMESRPDTKVIVSLYRDGVDGGSCELGVALHSDSSSLPIPLTFFTSDLSQEAYQAYSWLVDEYVEYLLNQGIPARRVFAEFEP